MPTVFELDDANRLVRTRGWDLVTAEDLLDLATRIRHLFADGRIDARWSELVDFRDVTRTELVPVEAVRQLARVTPWPRTARRVIVAPVTVVYGLSRMYQLLLASPDDALAVVRTEAEALEFLAVGQRNSAPPPDDTIQ